MALRTRKSSRSCRAPTEETLTECPTPEDEHSFAGDVRRRCIPVDCIPLCPTCQEHITPFTIIKKALKCSMAIVVIAYLASYLGNCTDRSKSDDVISSKMFVQQKDTDKVMNIMDMKMNNIINDLKELREEVECLQRGSIKHLTQEMKEETEQIVQNKLTIYDSDKTGLPDFALENLGGCIISVRGTKTYKEGAAHLSILGVPIMTFATDPRAIIQANVVPGDCWAFAGDKGTVVIQLSGPVLVTHISVEHISPRLSPTGEISSAPKDFLLKGLVNLDDKKPHIYGEFIYDKSGPTIQKFEVQIPTPKAYKMVEFSVLSNHGNKDFTCIYRVRIHGKPATPPPSGDQKKKT